MENSLQYFRALEAIDAIHAEDPRTEDNIPQELLYAQRMTACLHKLDPYASEALLLAARCQHLRRWAIDRNAFPQGAAGYKQWRKALTELHVEIADCMLNSIGYDRTTIERVNALIRKEKLKLDKESQILEDAVCLVFLEFEFSSFAAKHPEEKVLDILRKTWAKMSPNGQSHALKYSLHQLAMDLVQKAIAA